MKRFIRINLSVFFLGLFAQAGFGQSGTITTYAGLPFPVSGAQAVTQPINPVSAVPDGSGGLYVGSGLNRVYHVASDGVLTVFAGTGTASFSGDGGPATSAQLLSEIRGIAVDAAGSVFLADSENNRIRKVTRDGIIATIAGNGTPGFSGDGGLATSAQLYMPSGIAIDSAGNVFIADIFNARVRKVTPAGIISTVAGNGTLGSGGDGGPATSAPIMAEAVAVDTDGNLILSEFSNGRIRKVTPAGIITTVAGNGIHGFSGDGGPATSAQLSRPSVVAVDGTGNLFIADTGNNRIRKVTPSGTISTVAGNGTQGFRGDGGAALSAQLYLPVGVSVDAAGNLFITDNRNYRIRKVTPAGIISTAVGNGISGFGGDGGPATAALFDTPKGVAMDGAGNLFIADTGNHRVRKITPAGIISTVAGSGTSGFSGDSGPATSAQLNNPSSVAVDTAGNVYIADWSNLRVRKVTPAGVISTVAGNGRPGGNGQTNGDGGLATQASFQFPAGVTVDRAGNLFIADSQHSRIRKVTPAGIISTVAGNGMPGFSGDGGPATSAEIGHPNAIEVDATGNLFISANQRLRKVSPTGIISTVAGNGTSGSSGDGGPATLAPLFVITAIAIDAAGNVFIAEGASVRKITPTGIILKVAGSDARGFSGDGAPATSTELKNPNSIAVDASGNLYISDSGNHRIRKVTFAP